MKDRDAVTRFVCPSAQPGMDNPVAFGVIVGTPEEPRLAHLESPLRVTDDLLAMAGPVKPTEVFRFAAPCAQDACKHFDGKDCRLVQRVVQILPRVVSDLPPCTIRPSCLWWHQEGKSACLRCPQIVTETYTASADYVQAADS